MTRALVAAACLFLTGCSRYADFKLPVLPDGSFGSVRTVWSVAPEPILARGENGAWDSVDALNPSVVRADGQFWNFYSGYDGRAWHTGVATSDDGLAWTKRGGAILSPDPRTWEGDYIAANGSALHHNGEFLYWYQGGRIPQIGLATSKTAEQWSKRSHPVLTTGPRGSWDERGVADPYVLRVGEWFYMYYLGQDRARRQRLGVARSRDGIEWEKYRGNPILELGEAGAFDETGLGEPAVWSLDNWYWMLYTARDRKEYRRLGLARSKDGVNWSRVTTAPVLSGTTAWNSAVVCDPHVMPDSATVRVWFGGGNRPEPAENLNGQIGYATLKLEPAP
jgi:predicted GH43/DUF377 family glycosyl hydrolase